MKKVIATLLLSIMSIGIVTQTVFAAAELPKASVWFDPSTAAVNESITLNALVYNDQSNDATVIVAFTSPTETIGTATAVVAKGSAKTLTLAWKMPAKDTVVTASVTSALTSAKKSIPALDGALGTVTVGSTVTPTVTPPSIPGATQINAWFAPLLTKVEAFRIQQRDSYIVLKTNTQKNIDTSKASGNLWHSFVLLYATVLVAILTSQALFYVAGALLILIVLRFIVNLIF